MPPVTPVTNHTCHAKRNLAPTLAVPLAPPSLPCQPLPRSKKPTTRNLPNHDQSASHLEPLFLTCLAQLAAP
jgi:hypothetical protein